MAGFARMLDKHFFGNSAGNARPTRYFAAVEYNYGKAAGTEDFCRKAQLLNIEVNKAMYEGGSTTCGTTLRAS